MVGQHTSPGLLLIQMSTHPQEFVKILSSFRTNRLILSWKKLIHFSLPATLSQYLWTLLSMSKKFIAFQAFIIYNTCSSWSYLTLLKTMQKLDEFILKSSNWVKTLLIDLNQTASLLGWLKDPVLNPYLTWWNLTRKSSSMVLKIDNLSTQWCSVI